MTDDLVIENPEVVFFRKKGEEKLPTFEVIIASDMVEKLKADGWNVRHVWAGNDADSFDYLSVTVPESYGTINSYAMKKKGEVKKLVIRGYPWTVKHLSGVKAYLESMDLKKENDNG